MTDISNHPRRAARAVPWVLLALALTGLAGLPGLAVGQVSSRVDGQALIAAKPDEPSSYQSFATFLEATGDLKGAVEVLESGRSKAAGSAPLLVQLGRVYEAQDRMARAEAVTREALMIDSTLVDAHVRMGEIYFRLGWPKSGMESFRTACGLAPEQTLPKVRVVGGLIEQNKVQEAEDACLMFIADDADNPELWLALGQVFEKQDKLREAFTTYGQVLSLDPDQAEAYARQGRLFCRFGQFEAGRQACAKALQLDDNNMIAHAYMGIACSNLGDGDNARKHAQIAETGGMNMTVVWKKLEK
jgi:Tfp pilus assembly protein PilF